MLDVEGALRLVGQGGGIGPLRGLRLPRPSGGAQAGELDREGNGAGFIGLQADGALPYLAGGFVATGGDEGAGIGDEAGLVVEGELHLHLAAVCGGVVQDGLEQELVIQPGKTRQGRLDHEGLLDGDGGVGMAEIRRPLTGDGHEAETAEVVGRGEAGLDLALGIGHCAGGPECGGDEVLAGWWIGLAFISATSHDEALVAALAQFFVLGDDIAEV